MPHVRRRLLVTFDAPVEQVRAAAERQFSTSVATDAPVDIPAYAPIDTTMRLFVTIDADYSRVARAQFVAESTIDVPYFGWFVRALAYVSAGRELRYATAQLRAALDGAPPPPPPRKLPIFPPVPFTPEQAARLGTVAFIAVIANFCGTLLTQNGDAVTKAFGKGDSDLGFALAIARAGVLVSLVAAAMADRFGRRRLILMCLVGACLANALAAAAPSFEVFTGAQLFTRAFVNAALVIGSIAAIEEAPEQARAFAFAMFGLAFGVGVGLSVLLLPLADIGNFGWRISFALSALLVFFIPRLARDLRETERYASVAARLVQRGRLREVFTSSYRVRFVLLGVAAFLINVFAAPSSQLTNRYLRRAHDFTNAKIGLFRGVTAGVPGLVGVIIAGKVAESRGRRVVTILGLLVATSFQVLFFLSSGALLWIAPTIAIVATAFAGIAIGTLDSELFPTEVRGTSNGFLLVCGVTGSATGLVLATTVLKSAVGTLGPAIALCAIAPVAAALLIFPRLPETADRRLDDVSPSEM